MSHVDRDLRFGVNGLAFFASRKLFGRVSRLYDALTERVSGDHWAVTGLCVVMRGLAEQMDRSERVLVEDALVTVRMYRDRDQIPSRSRFVGSQAYESTSLH